MRGVLLLAWRYITHHRIRSALLVSCVALIAFLPIALELLIDLYQHSMQQRAQDTPILVGAPGSPFDLLLSGLYFKGEPKHTIPYQTLDEIERGDFGFGIPLYQRHTVAGHPVIGTTFDYFELRALSAAEGALPAQLGDAVVGAQLAEALDLHADDSVITDTKTVHDTSASYPLKLRITGVLEETGGADDWVILTTLKTAWIISGIGHGHAQVDPEMDPQLVQEQRGDEVVTNAKVYEYTEITDANRNSFHFHGGPADWPVTAIIITPKDAKAHTVLVARLSHNDALLALVPERTLHDLLDVVFRIKRFFDANLVLVLTATLLFLTLIILLTLKVRERELETLFKIGCSRMTTVALMATELVLLCSSGLIVATGAAASVYAWATNGLLWGW